MDGLFPDLPEDVKALSEEDLAQLVSDHESAVELIKSDDEEFLRGLEGHEIIAQLENGVNQIEVLRAEQADRSEAHEAFVAKKEELTARLEKKDEAKSDDSDPGDEDEEDEEEGAEKEVVVEAPVKVEAAEEVEEEQVEERELVLASARYARRPPAASPERTPVTVVEEVGTALMASGDMTHKFPDPLDPHSLAELVKASAMHHGPMPKIDPPGKYRFGGPEHKIAHADFAFPEERQLGSDVDLNLAKLQEVIPAYIPGGVGRMSGESLVASGGLCAPLTPIYSMPQFATDDEPVWDALPKFQAARGGVNVPEATVIGDITEAISSISEANDALGGTFATKSCQDLDCPPYTEVAVQILAHCREYGNLNARAWPEKIAHENELTMAALARTSETFMLDRIKALSVNVTNGVETLGALIYLVDGIVKSSFGIRSRLRMPASTRFRALLPAVATDILLLDTIQTQFDRFRGRASLVAYLREVGIDPVFYLDSPSTGTTQIADAAQTAAAIDPLPDNIQWALYPEGAFIGVDSGSLELGIVRDSTLNSTNDFQVFGEKFRNVARLAPAQAAYWVTTDLCATGQFPPAGHGTDLRLRMRKGV